MSQEERDPLLAALEQDEGSQPVSSVDPEREKALEDFKQKLKDHREWDAKLKELRLGIRDLEKQYSRTEDVSAEF
jgi:26S proteasome regulatory subunit T4